MRGPQQQHSSLLHSMHRSGLSQEQARLPRALHGLVHSMHSVALQLAPPHLGPGQPPLGAFHCMQLSSRDELSALPVRMDSHADSREDSRESERERERHSAQLSRFKEGTLRLARFGHHHRLPPPPARRRNPTLTAPGQQEHPLGLATTRARTEAPPCRGNRPTNEDEQSQRGS